jgi:MoxR-like ATPase
VFGNIVLADEINRATPRTQAALLEAMQEGQVTVDGVSHPLSRPFLVVATQNPVEFEGTFPLPEAQLDRFMMRLAIGYPDAEVASEILASHAAGAPLDDIRPVSDASGVREMIEEARRIHAAPPIRRYIVDLVEATRRHSDVYLGASPRASIMLLRAARALAAAEERDYVIPDDVKTLAPVALPHRIIVTADAIMSGRSAEVLVREIIDEVDVPIAENP